MKPEVSRSACFFYTQEVESFRLFCATEKISKDCTGLRHVHWTNNQPPFRGQYIHSARLVRYLASARLHSNSRMYILSSWMHSVTLSISSNSLQSLQVFGCSLQLHWIFDISSFSLLVQKVYVTAVCLKTTGAVIGWTWPACATMLV